MNNLDGAVTEWLAENDKEMILCPYQPGNLKISPDACRKRHLASQKVKELGWDVKLHAYKGGLELCRECPIGKKLCSRSAPVVFADHYWFKNLGRVRNHGASKTRK
jgi:hypothetical protein